MKIDRTKVYDKFEGHCAYCGDEIKFKGFQIDHIHPQFLAHFEPNKDNNRLENLNPACPKCNKFKSSFRLEDYRRELSLQVPRLLNENAQFKRALKFGQIKLTQKPIVFFFETEKGKAF